VNLYFINCIFFYCCELTVSKCVWRWSCGLSHESRWCSSWCWWRI